MIFQHIMVVLPHLVSVHTQVAKPKVENSPPQSLKISLPIFHKAGWCCFGIQDNVLASPDVDAFADLS